MRLSYGGIGLATVLVVGGCGDDASSGDASDGSGSSSATTVSSISDPTSVGDDSPTPPPPDPDSSSGGDTETEPDLPPPSMGDCTDLDTLVAELEKADGKAQVALVDEYIRTMTYGDRGFPGVQGNEFCVAYWGEPDDDLSVAGDFNAWVPGQVELVEAVPDLGFYTARIELLIPPEGLYKIVRGDKEFFADPLARRHGWDEFGEYSQIDPMPDRSHYERWPGFDEGVGSLEPRTVTTYVPQGAGKLSDLPVLYMQDGQNLFSPEAFFGGWMVGETLDAAIEEGSVQPLIVVGIDNTAARMDEYTFVTDIIDGMEVGGRADEYADFLVGGIKPFIEQRYPVSDDPALVGVMGSSLGGLASLFIGWRHQELFGHAGSMSGTIDWGTLGTDNATIDSLYQADTPTGLNIYLDSGGDEGMGCPDGDTDNYCGNIRFRDLLFGLGWTDQVDLFYTWTPGAMHNEAAWAQRLRPALESWFPGV
ncbi:MAG: alpha/beta hydrolase-fold protein [Myxococcota bacterium]